MPSAFVATIASSPSRSMMNSAAPVSPSERSRTERSSPGATSSVATGSMCRSTISWRPSSRRSNAPSDSGSSVRWRRQPRRVAIQPA